MIELTADNQQTVQNEPPPGHDFPLGVNGFTYADLERYLDEGPQGVSPALAMRIERLTRSTEHKRQMPPMPDEG